MAVEQITILIANREAAQLPVDRGLEFDHTELTRAWK